MRSRVFEGLKIKRKLRHLFGGVVETENMSCSSDDSEGLEESETKKSERVSIS